MDAQQAPFNPILVWFYLPQIFTFVCDLIAFNPILVWFYRLRRRFRWFWVWALSIPFWSDFIPHYNIRSWWQYNYFQSHFGLILSSSDKVAAYSQYHSFNPILVWFYLDMLVKTQIFAPAFQSHFGLILSQITSQSASVSIRSFNPILVWFYPELRAPLL